MSLLWVYVANHPVCAFVPVCPVCPYRAGAVCILEAWSCFCGLTQEILPTIMSAICNHHGTMFIVEQQLATAISLTHSPPPLPHTPSHPRPLWVPPPPPSPPLPVIEWLFMKGAAGAALAAAGAYAGRREQKGSRGAAVSLTEGLAHLVDRLLACLQKLLCMYLQMCLQLFLHCIVLS